MTIRLDLPGSPNVPTRAAIAHTLPVLARELIAAGVDPQEDWVAGFEGESPHIRGASLLVLAGVDQDMPSEAI